MNDFSEQLSRNKTIGRATDDLQGTQLQYGLGAPVESGNFALMIERQQTDGHVFHDVIRKRLYPGKRCPRRSIALNQKQQGEPGKTHQQQNSSHDNGVPHVCPMSFFYGAHVQPYKYNPG